MSGGAGVTCDARPTRVNWPRVFMSLKRALVEQPTDRADDQFLQQERQQ
jgi:hypothetical protein